MHARVVSAAVLVSVMVLATLGGLAASAGADSLPPFPTCAAWESLERNHGSARCVPRACERAAQCGGGTCETRRVCLVREEVFISSPGPCRDMDGDGECDRRRGMRDREAGACPSEGQCAEGSCVTRGSCRPRPPAR